MEISLEQLLESRDLRAQKQRDLLENYPEKTLLSLTVIMPGKVKRNEESVFVANEAVKILKQEFEGVIEYFEQKDLMTGFEAYFVVDKDKIETKKHLCKIEEEHPLGRLFDIDVIGSDGIPISRKDIGFSPRKCLICEQESRYCMRNFTHTQEELKQKIMEMVRDYQNNLKEC